MLKAVSDEAQALKRQATQAISVAAAVTTVITIEFLWANQATVWVQAGALLLIFAVIYPIGLWIQWAIARPMGRRSSDTGIGLRLNGVRYKPFRSILSVVDDQGALFRVRVYGPRKRVQEALRFATPG